MICFCFSAGGIVEAHLLSPLALDTLAHYALFSPPMSLSGRSSRVLHRQRRLDTNFETMNIPAAVRNETRSRCPCSVWPTQKDTHTIILTRVVPLLRSNPNLCLRLRSLPAEILRPHKSPTHTLSFRQTSSKTIRHTSPVVFSTLGKTSKRRMLPLQTRTRTLCEVFHEAAGGRHSCAVLLRLRGKLESRPLAMASVSAALSTDNATFVGRRIHPCGTSLRIQV